MFACWWTNHSRAICSLFSNTALAGRRCPHLKRQPTAQMQFSSSPGGPAQLTQGQGGAILAAQAAACSSPTKPGSGTIPPQPVPPSTCPTRWPCTSSRCPPATTSPRPLARSLGLRAHPAAKGLNIWVFMAAKIKASHPPHRLPAAAPQSLRTASRAVRGTSTSTPTTWAQASFGGASRRSAGALDFPIWPIPCSPGIRGATIENQPGQMTAQCAGCVPRGQLLPR